MLSLQGFKYTFEYAELFKQGLVCTLLLSALTVFFGFILALVLSAMRMGAGKKNFFARLFAALSTAYVEFVRATPMLVQLMIFYHVIFSGVSLPHVKIFGFIRFERFLPGAVTLSLNSAAYLSEIIRSGIKSIDMGQTEAARSLGLSQFKNMRYVVLPQAIKNILPAIANEFVTIIKESSICYTIGVQDIMSAVWAVNAATFTIGEPLVIATLTYFCLTFPTSKIIARFERKMGRGDVR